MQRRPSLESASLRGPHRGLFAVGVFLFFGATVAVLAGASLVWPGTLLDEMWVLNPRALRRLAQISKQAGTAFLLFGIIMALAGVGWFRRRRWAWKLTIAIFAAQFLGDLINFLRGEFVGGIVGCAIAGALVAYLRRPEIRGRFRTNISATD